MAKLALSLIVAVGLLAAGPVPVWAQSVRSWPKDTTPYTRPAIPEDHAPAGRSPVAPLGPSASGDLDIVRIVDTVVNNTDPSLKTTDTYNDSEISIAVNPQNPDEIVIAAYSGAWTAYNQMAPLWYSTDGGQTWAKLFVINQPNVPGTTFCPCNQTVDFGRYDRLFYDVITVSPNYVYAGGPTGPALTGWAWPPSGYGNAPMRVDHGRGFTDQPWLLISRDPVTPAQDNVYVAYDDFGGGGEANATVRVSVSAGTAPLLFYTDNPVGTSEGSVNPGLRLAKDPRNGYMYSFFQNCPPGCGPLYAPSKTVEYLLNRSTNAGQTWTLNGSSTGIVVATAESTQPNPKFGTVNSLLGGITHGTVDPSNGDVYYVYGNRNPATGNNRLAIRRLVDDGAGGLGIGPEHFVTGEVQAALPSVAVTDNGAVGVFYYTFDGFSGGFPQFTTHLAVSWDGGGTFTDHTLSTFLSSATDDGDSRQRVFGDYVQMKAVGNCFYGGFTGNGVPFGRSFANHDPIFYKACAQGAPPPPSVTLDRAPTSAVPGGGVTATWSGIASPTALDWIGLYVPGSADTAYLAWIYVSCTQAPGAPLAAGSCSFPIPNGLPSGTYELRLLANNGYVRLATSDPVTVAPPVGATLSSSPTTVPAGGSLTATWSAIPAPTALDWIGLFVPGSANTAYIAWIYVSCTQAPGAPFAAGSCAFKIPSGVAPGTYQLRLLANNGYTALATGNSFTVGPAGPGLNISPPTVVHGGSVTAAWSGIVSPTSTDWIGLFVPGSAETAYLAWIYVSCSHVPGGAMAAGSCSFTIPAGLTPGMYELRLFTNNGYTRLATGNPLTVN